MQRRLDLLKIEACYSLCSTEDGLRFIGECGPALYPEKRAEISYVFIDSGVESIVFASTQVRKLFLLTETLNYLHTCRVSCAPVEVSLVVFRFYQVLLTKYTR